jgi:hypothetical protein
VPVAERSAVHLERRAHAEQQHVTTSAGVRAVVAGEADDLDDRARLGETVGALAQSDHEACWLGSGRHALVCRDDPGVVDEGPAAHGRAVEQHAHAPADSLTDDADFVAARAVATAAGLSSSFAASVTSSIVLTGKRRGACGPFIQGVRGAPAGSRVDGGAPVQSAVRPLAGLASVATTLPDRGRRTLAALTPRPLRPTARRAGQGAAHFAVSRPIERPTVG